MHLLHARRAVVRHADVHVGLAQRVAQLAAAAAGRARPRVMSLGVRRLDAPPARAACCRWRRSAAARRRAGPAPAPAWRTPASTPSSLRKRGQHRAVGRQRERRQTRAARARSGRRTGRAEVLRQRRRPPPRPQTSTLPPPVMQPISACDRRGNRLGQDLGGLVLQVGAVEELLLDALFEHGHGSYDTATCTARLPRSSAVTSTAGRHLRRQGRRRRRAAAIRRCSHRRSPPHRSGRAAALARRSR